MKMKTEVKIKYSVKHNPPKNDEVKNGKDKPKDNK